MRHMLPQSNLYMSPRYPRHYITKKLTYKEGKNHITNRIYVCSAGNLDGNIHPFSSMSTYYLGNNMIFHPYFLCRAGLRNRSLLWSCTGRGRIRFLGSAKRDCSSSSPRLILRPSQELRRTVVCNAGCCAIFEGPSSSRLHLSSSRRLPHSTYFVIRSVS